MKTAPAARNSDLSHARAARLLAHPAVGPVGVRRLAAGGPVAIAGAGAVGLPLACALTAAGVHLVLIDHGRVEPENAALQWYGPDMVGRPKCEAAREHLHRLRPDLAVTCLFADVRGLGAGQLADCRLVVGCVDNFSARICLAETTTHLGLPYVDLALDGTGQSLYGRVSGFDVAGGTACLCCAWDETVWNDSGAAGCAALATAEPDAPATLALPGLAGAIAGLGAIQVLRCLLGDETDRVLGREWRLNLSSGRLDETRLARAARCRASHRVWEVRRLRVTPAAMTVAALAGMAARALEGEVALRAHGAALVRAAGCPGCQSELRLLRLSARLPDCPDCGHRLVPLAHATRSHWTLAEVPEALDVTWSELGLPPAGAVIATGDGGRALAYVFADQSRDAEGEPGPTNAAGAAEPPTFDQGPDDAERDLQ